MSRRLFAVVAVAWLFAPVAARATTIDFESTPVGTYAALPFGDVTITFEAGTHLFDVVDNGPGQPGPPLSGHELISYFKNPGPGRFKAAFSIPGVRSFSIDVGDFDADVDNDFLQVYDASNNLIGSDSFVNPASNFGGGTMSVNTSADIAYALFWDDEPFAGAVYWDNLTYEAATTTVPEPASLLLLGGGLIGAAARKRRARA